MAILEIRCSDVPTGGPSGPQTQRSGLRRSRKCGNGGGTACSLRTQGLSPTQGPVYVYICVCLCVCVCVCVYVYVSVCFWLCPYVCVSVCASAFVSGLCACLVGCVTANKMLNLLITITTVSDQKTVS